MFSKIGENTTAYGRSTANRQRTKVSINRSCLNFIFSFSFCFFFLFLFDTKRKRKRRSKTKELPA